MNIQKLAIIVALYVLPLITPVSANEVKPEKALVCVSCHGALGISNYDLWPNIKGQKRGYLASQLKAFRDGKRYDPWMSPIAVPLSDKDIQELADFFSTL